MGPLLVFLFGLGVALGIIVCAISPPPRPKSSPKKKYPGDRLDMVDEMFLWGEVNNDDFYKM